MSTPTDTPTPDPLQNLSTRELETELLTLAGHVAAAQCRFLQLLAEYDRRNGWAGPELRSCAHWLSWRIGMSLRTASEHVRVAHALAQLPAVTAAFAAGKISYSKVRAITRLIDTRRSERAEQGTAILADAARLGTGDHVDDQSTEDSERWGPSGTDDPSTGAMTPELAADSEQVLLGVAMSGTAGHLERVVRATRRRQADPLAPAALREVSWRWADDGSLILRGRFAPADGAAMIAAIEAQLPATHSLSHDDPPAPDDWQERAPEQEPGAVVDRVGARRADALVHLVTEGGSAPQDAERHRPRTTVILHLESGAESRAELLAGPEVPRTTAERLACDADVQALLEDTRSNRLYLGRRQRLATPAQIAALTARDGRRCQFPGCSNTRYLNAHHVQHWLHGGRTDVDNLLMICTFHHSLIHDHGYQIHRTQGRWNFLRGDGQPVRIAPTPLSGRAESLIETSTRAGLSITRDCLTPDWGGERLDLDFVLDRLLPRPARVAA